MRGFFGAKDHGHVPEELRVANEEVALSVRVLEGEVGEKGEPGNKTSDHSANAHNEETADEGTWRRCFSKSKNKENGEKEEIPQNPNESAQPKGKPSEVQSAEEREAGHCGQMDR